MGDFFDPTIGMSFSDAPLEVIGEIIDNLQDRFCWFEGMLADMPIPSPIVLWIHLSNYHSHAPFLGGKTLRSSMLHHIVWKSSGYQFADLWLHSESHIQNRDSWLWGRVCALNPSSNSIFSFSGHRCMDWSALCPDLQEYLLCMIHSVTHLDISFIPIGIFIPCINLVDLRLDSITGNVTDSYKYGYFGQDTILQWQSLTLGRDNW